MKNDTKERISKELKRYTVELKNMAREFARSGGDSADFGEIEVSEPNFSWMSDTEVLDAQKSPDEMTAYWADVEAYIRGLRPTTTYQISTLPEYYGSAANEEDAASMAEKIAGRLAAEYPDVEIQIVDGPTTLDSYDEGQLEIQQYVNDHWLEWVL